MSVIQEYQAFNMIRPFESHYESNRQAETIAAIMNTKATKKSHIVNATDLYPYLRPDASRFDDSKLKKVIRIIKSLTMKEQFESVLEKIMEEIKIASEAVEPDNFYIYRLNQIAGDVVRKIGELDK